MSGATVRSTRETGRVGEGMMDPVMLPLVLLLCLLGLLAIR